MLEIWEQPFYIVSVQNYFNLPGECQPAEIAFLEISLDKGITKEFHALLKPSKQ